MSPHGLNAKQASWNTNVKLKSIMNKPRIKTQGSRMRGCSSACVYVCVHEYVHACKRLHVREQISCLSDLADPSKLLYHTLAPSVKQPPGSSGFISGLFLVDCLYPKLLAAALQASFDWILLEPVGHLFELEVLLT